MLALAPLIAGIAGIVCMVIAARRGRSALGWGAIGLGVGLIGALIGGIVGSILGQLLPTGSLVEYGRTIYFPIIGVGGVTYFVIKRIQRPVGDRRRPAVSKILVLVLSFIGGVTVLLVIWSVITVFPHFGDYEASFERESGVKLSGEMDAYALEYLTTHNLLNSSETLVAYYDHTFLMNGMVATILTNERLISHDERTTSFRLPQIKNIETKIKLVGPNDSVFVEFEIANKSGEVLMFSIAADDSAERFKNLLMDAWEGSK